MNLQLQSVYGSARKAVSKEQMVSLLYRGASRWITEAIGHMESGQWDQVADRVHRGQAVLYELSAAVDRDAGGEVADHLLALYSYWIRRLTDGLTDRNPAPLQEVAGYLDDLAISWEEAARKIRAQRSGGEMADVPS